MNITIQKLLPNHSTSYRELRLECLKNYPQYFSTNYADELTKEKLYFQSFIEQSDTDNFVIGAFDGQTLIGISGFKRHEAKKTEHAGIVVQVYVNPEYQGNTIGTDMIKATLDAAFKIEGIEQIEIGVISTNENAEKIYTKMGFEVFGLHKNYLKIDHHYYDHKMMMVFKNTYKV
ncbi:MAG: GNAT family N-acetyltransferase [Aquaticitalea sp.]